jgi:hypothetical protein
MDILFWWRKGWTVDMDILFWKEYTGHEEYTDKIPVKQGTVQNQYL